VKDNQQPEPWFGSLLHHFKVNPLGGGAGVLLPGLLFGGEAEKVAAWRGVGINMICPVDLRAFERDWF